MSRLDQNWSNLNPPPQGPIIGGSIKLMSVNVGEGGFRSHWPTLIYPKVINTDSTINFSIDDFNYLNVVVDNPVTLTLLNIPKGYQIVYEINGLSTLKIVIDGLSLNLTKGTYLVVLFTNGIKYSEFTNPTAL